MDLETIARELAEVSTATADLASFLHGHNPSPTITAAQMRLRRVAARLHAALEPTPAPAPSPPPAPTPPDRDRTFDAPRASEIRYVAAENISTRNLTLKKGEEFPPNWGKAAIARLYGEPAQWPAPWCQIKIERAPVVG